MAAVKGIKINNKAVSFLSYMERVSSTHLDQIEGRASLVMIYFSSK